MHIPPFFSQSVSVCGIETTVQLLLTHLQLPAPQSIGPSHESVHAVLQAVLYFSFIHDVGWQHCSGTQSSSVSQTFAFAPAGIKIGLDLSTETDSSAVLFAEYNIGLDLSISFPKAMGALNISIEKTNKANIPVKIFFVFIFRLLYLFYSDIFT